MIELRSPLEIEADSQGRLRLVLWAGNAFDYATPFRDILAAIAAALAPSKVAGLVNLAGPIDFAQAGDLRHMVSPEWFDAEAIAGAGNITAPM